MKRIEITTFIDQRGGVLFRTRPLSEQRVELWRAGIIDSNAAIYPERSQADDEKEDVAE